MIEKSRPILDLKKDSLSSFFDIASLFIVGFLWLFSILKFAGLPEQIPTHFDWQGNPDDFGSRNTIFMLPVIVTLLVALLKFLSRYPHRFNYLSTITPENAASQYKQAIRMISYIQFIIPLFFAYINIEIVEDARSGHAGFSPAIIFVMIAFISIPSVAMMLGASKKSK